MGRRRSLQKDRALRRVGFLKEEQEKGAVVLFSVLRIGGQRLQNTCFRLVHTLSYIKW